jgi:hypothetical protein
MMSHLTRTMGNRILMLMLMLISILSSLSTLKKHLPSPPLVWSEVGRTARSLSQMHPHLLLPLNPDLQSASSLLAATGNLGKLTGGGKNFSSHPRPPGTSSRQPASTPTAVCIPTPNPRTRYLLRPNVPVYRLYPPAQDSRRRKRSSQAGRRTC